MIKIMCEIEIKMYSKSVRNHSQSNKKNVYSKKQNDHMENQDYNIVL